MPVVIIWRPEALQSADEVFTEQITQAFFKLSKVEPHILRHFHDIDKKEGFNKIDKYLQSHAKVVQYGYR